MSPTGVYPHALKEHPAELVDKIRTLYTETAAPADA